MVVISMKGASRADDQREYVIVDTRNVAGCDEDVVHATARSFKSRLEIVFAQKLKRSTQNILHGFERGAAHKTFVAPLPAARPAAQPPHPRFEEPKGWRDKTFDDVEDDSSKPRKRAKTKKVNVDDDDDIDLTVTVQRAVAPVEFDPVQENMDLVRKFDAQGLDGEALVRKMFSREPAPQADPVPVARPQTMGLFTQNHSFENNHAETTPHDDCESGIDNGLIEDEMIFEAWLVRRGSIGSILKKSDDDAETIEKSDDNEAVEELVDSESLNPFLQLPDQPTLAKPGSPEKCAILEWRYEAGLPLWHKDDQTGHGPLMSGVLKFFKK